MTTGPATLVRITGTWEFTVDEAVAERGHKPCKGWQLSGDKRIICRCGTVLFPLAEVLA